MERSGDLSRAAACSRSRAEACWEVEVTAASRLRQRQLAYELAAGGNECVCVRFFFSSTSLSAPSNTDKGSKFSLHSRKYVPG